MPVIEQAKGIIMAQSQSGDAQAFDLLGRASQRGNMPVRELAAQIVAKTAQAAPEADAADLTRWRGRVKGSADGPTATASVSGIRARSGP